MRHGQCWRRAAWLLALSWMIAEPTTALGQDWSQWRGPQRDGKAAAELLPNTMPAELERRWRVEVGVGYSSPVVAGDRVFLLTREADEEVVRSLDLSSGDALWRQSYDVPYQMNASATRHGKGPKSTPAVSGGRLYVLGIDGILSCFDAEAGDLVWRCGFWPLWDERDHCGSSLPARSGTRGAPARGAVSDLGSGQGVVLAGGEAGYTVHQKHPRVVEGPRTR